LTVVVSEIGERRLLNLIRARLTAARHRSHGGLVIGIGDDAAVVAPRRNAYTVLTTDAQLEGVHFDRRFSTAADIGYRALAVNLSDLAAMGSHARWALLSLGLPDETAVSEIEELIDGIVDCGDAHGIEVIGGNVTRSPQSLVVDITAVGEVLPRRVLTRNGGRPGDELWLSGTIGGAAAGLEMLRAGAADAGTGEAQRACVERYRRPQPRVKLGIAIAQARAARAAIDLSDGLADAAHQLAEASNCGIEVDGALVPIEEGARAWWVKGGRDPLTSALSGGDDYELLLAVPRNRAGQLRHARSRVAVPTLTRIGVLTKDRSARVLRRDGRKESLPEGFTHWS
jgi:thiamine-monophosphate kinase